MAFVEYTLNLQAFSGPLDKLLSLVEEKKLPINEISLAQVTNDFLAYVKTLETVETPFLADFILVASRLILIKSKSLLPELTLTEEEQGEIKDLESRLKVYGELKHAMKLLDKEWQAGSHSWTRPYLMIRQMTPEEGAPANIFYPGGNVNSRTLVASLERIMTTVQKLTLEEDAIKERIVSIEEKIREIVSRLAAAGEATFRSMAGEKPRSEIIATFLALLHLAREQLIFLEQQEYFSDIIVRSRQ